SMDGDRGWIWAVTHGQADNSPAEGPAAPPVAFSGFRATQRPRQACASGLWVRKQRSAPPQMYSLLADPWFYVTAVPAVVLVGLSKGGLGGAMALIGVPLMTLVISPVQAAAIMLPILIVMDIVSLWSWRGHRDDLTLKLMLPGALAGIGIGWLTAAVVTAGAVRLIVGVVALAFALRWLWQKLRSIEHVGSHSAIRGTFWGVISGFTSFVAHAGG